MVWLALVLGGVRSGKSRFAEQLAARWPPVTYLATATAGDEEMAARIDRHRRRRPPEWGTVEEPWELPAAVSGLLRTESSAPGCVLVECLTLWVSNLVVGSEGRPGLADDEVRGRVSALVEAVREGTGRVVVVSNEVGCGVIPANALARRFGDLLGEANQALAAAADEVHACVAGIPVRIK